MPWMWGLDRHASDALALPMSMAPLMVLLCGWPLTILSLVPVAALTGWLGGVGLSGALSDMVWLGVVPASIALVFGGATRRFLPHHIFTYILARAWFGTFVTCILVALLLGGPTVATSVVTTTDLFIAAVLNASGEAMLTGALVSAMAVFRPDWLATYTDQLYLPQVSARIDRVPSLPPDRIP